MRFCIIVWVFSVGVCIEGTGWVCKAGGFEAAGGLVKRGVLRPPGGGGGGV